MRLIKFFVVFQLIALAFIFSSSAYAATPTPTIPESAREVIGLIQKKCGLAGVDGSNSCCVTFESKLDESAKKTTEKVENIPIFGGLIAGFVENFYDLYSIDPVHPIIDRECYYGDPVKRMSTDPKTKKTIESCACSTDKYEAAYKAENSTMKLWKLCEKYANVPEKAECRKCADSEGIMTGLGCIPINYSQFISNFLLRIGIGFAGLIALGCIIISAITIQTSGGDAEKISKAQDQIKSCIFGLLLVMFSILLLKIIGVSILGIPGFI